MLRASSRRALVMLVTAALTVAVVAGIALATAPSSDVEKPTLAPRTPVAGANKGGLFGDGVTNVGKVDTAGWKTYSNAKYGYSFLYPPTWEVQDADNSAFHGPNGEPAYPLQAVSVKNPASERGQNLPGVNCQDVACSTTLPKALGFYVAILPEHCAVPGDLIVADTITLDGRQGARCVIRAQTDGVSRFVYMGFPLGDGKNLIDVSLERGRSVTPGEQALLETVLSTFKFTAGGAR